MKDKTNRIQLLDELRGFAIVAMVIHHTFLDIGYVLGLNWGYEIFDKLCVVQPLFWAIFIIISGICSRLSRNSVKRGAIVLGCGIVITIVTVFVMPPLGFDGEQIYFGILSCLGTCMIITGLAMPIIKKINANIGVIVTTILFFVTYNISSGTLLFGLIKLQQSMYQTNIFAPLGFYNTSFFSADYFPLIPWIFMFLFGAFVGEYAKKGKFPQWTYKKHFKIFSFVGRNSLWVYLAHQPVIYALLYIVLGISLIV